jgi:hypothetical protein
MSDEVMTAFRAVAVVMALVLLVLVIAQVPDDEE